MSRLCVHFGSCGGCSFQDMPAEAYSQMKREQIVRALARHGFEDVRVDMPLEVSSHTRRRATLAFAIRGATAEIGFRAARSHAIVDLRECLVLAPALVSLILSFRDLLPSLLRNGEQGELGLTRCDNGIDVALNLVRRVKPELPQILADWGQRNNVIRIVVNDEIAVQFGEPALQLADAKVAIPPNSFLQPTREGERVLQDVVAKTMARVSRIVDLFAGCGTFTFAVARRASVHAVDADKAALAALSGAARKAPKLKPITTETRDLFRQPLQPAELARFDAAVLDPPRAGAAAQAAALANSAVERLTYVSCNPETFARDAGILAGRGFRIVRVCPVDQFLWSSHIELVAHLERH